MCRILVGCSNLNNSPKCNVQFSFYIPSAHPPVAFHDGFSFISNFIGLFMLLSTLLINELIIFSRQWNILSSFYSIPSAHMYCFSWVLFYLFIRLFLLLLTSVSSELIILSLSWIWVTNNVTFERSLSTPIGLPFI